MKTIVTASSSVPILIWMAVKGQIIPGVPVKLVVQQYKKFNNLLVLSLLLSLSTIVTINLLLVSGRR